MNMFISIQTNDSYSKQVDTAKNVLLESIYPIALLSLALAITSCQTNTSPTGPQNWDDADLWNSALVDPNGAAQFIAALHPDGIPRLYGGTFEYTTRLNGGTFEYTYTNGAWSTTRIDPSTSGFLSTAVGKCKSDGVLRMYGLSPTAVSELNYTGNQWTMQDIAPLANAYQLAIGDPRNDGYGSLYVVSTDGLHEVRYWNSSWQDTLIDSTSMIAKICGGDGRGDGKGGIYIMDGSTTIFELRYQNCSWMHSTIGQVMALPPNITVSTALSVTNSHNGRPNIVASADNIVEFYFDTDHWTQLKIGSEPGVNQIADGIGRNDGIDRIYCAVDWDIMAEYTLAGSSWVKTSQRKTSETYSAIMSVMVGPGKGDGINRVYVTDNIGGLSEFTFKH
jgi:hypothetical protein